MEPKQSAFGRIKSFDQDSGSGYIEPAHGGREIPFDREHVQGYHPGEVIAVGDRVAYDVRGGMAGIEAVHVRRITDRP